MLKPKRGRTMSEPTPRHPPSRGTLPPAHPQSGLIVTPNPPTQPVETKSALDNHSHRTSSGRDLSQATVGGPAGGEGSTFRPRSFKLYHCQRFQPPAKVPSRAANGLRRHFSKPLAAG